MESEGRQPGFELTRLGLRFVSRDVEAQFRDWHARDALAFLRVTYAASLLVAFPCALAAAWFAAPASFALVSRVVLLVLTPLLVAGLASTYRPWILRWMGPATVVPHAVAGCVFVWLSYNVLQRPDLAMASTVICVFIAFSVLRMHFGAAVVAMLPYFVIDEVLMARAETLSTLGIYTSVNVIAVALGALVGWMMDRTSRASYRQRCIIEAQQQMIDHARDTELARVNDEVRRQVAERSRELSEALAKLSPAQLTMDADRTIDGRYRVVRRLGAGGMGAVYEVERTSDKQRLALKTLRGRAHPDTLARLAREAQIAAQLSHPNLVPVLDVGIADGMLFLVMPLVAGGSLEQQRARFGDATWAAPLLASIAAGLAVLHERGILHRDLKPANILLADGVPQIADFGLSSLTLDPGGETFDSVAAHADTKTPLTGAGDLMGTPAYMAPELATGASAASPASDVFAFGVLACELMHGRTPFAEAVVLARVQGRLIPPPNIDGIAAPIARCIELEPAKRPTASELAAALAT